MRAAALVSLRPITGWRTIGGMVSSGTDPVATASALAPEIRSHLEEIEAVRRLPQPLVESFRDAGIFRLLVPRSVGGLEVDPANMRRNLDATRGMIAAEAVMMALAPAVGRQTAHHLVAAGCRQAVERGAHLAEVLAADPKVTAHLTPERLRQLLDPENYTGLAGAFVDRVLADRQIEE